MDLSRLTAVEDRLAIAELVHSYAQAVDGRDPEGAAALFTSDGELVVWSDAGSEPPPVRRGREQIAGALAGLDRYRATFHAISSHTVVLSNDVATGRTGCVAHHVSGSGDQERDRVWYLSYTDTFRREAEGWRIARRELRVKIVEEYPLSRS
ncbi:MAG: nuclear transport factor 2 family protein [Acidimicrobiales bacterium]